MLRAFIRQFLPTDPYAPSIFRAMFSRPYRNLRRLESGVRAATQSSVASGPFIGMVYTWRSLGSALAPKLLGTYEKELWSIVSGIITTDYESVIDLGAAEGYYAVGLARLMPQARVIAFEAQAAHHDVLLNMAESNGVSNRIELHGFATAELLGRCLSTCRRSLIVCDVEGFELELLDPSIVPSLQNTDILVEVHDFIQPDISAVLTARFEQSHQIVVVPTCVRTLADWPPHVEYGNDQLKIRAMHEGRPAEMAFFWMRSRQQIRA
jgi:hypothetical protein